MTDTTREWQVLAAEGARLVRATVIAVEESRDRVEVRLSDDQETITCEVLVTGADPVSLSPGDPVLIWRPSREGELAVILGAIGNRSSPLPAEAPDVLVLEAKHSLTLRVGDGSITIREDGKILIKGRDLVSHAKRLNRIRGGSVQIN